MTARSSLNSCLELGDVSDVIDTFVEASGELGSDGLDGNFLIGEGGEDDEEFGRGLGAVGLIHGNFGDEILAFDGNDVVVDRLGLLGGFEELVGGFLHIGSGYFERRIDAFDADGADEFGVVVDECGDVGRVGGFADVIGDIEGEEITWGDEAVHGLEIDVVGIEQVGAGPAEIFDRGIGSIAGGLRLGTDDVVLAVGFVPDRADVDAEFFGGDEGLELGMRAIGETISDAEGEFRAGFHMFWNLKRNHGWPRIGFFCLIFGG